MRIEMVLVAVLAVSCGDVPREGDKCAERACDYAADGRILECMDGHLRAFDCNGGCRTDAAGDAYCDPRGARAGDTCPPELGLTSTCGASGGRMLCFSGIWQELAACEIAAGDDFSACDTDDKGINAQCFSCGYGSPAHCSRN